MSKAPAAGAGWLRGELHCHTWHSDGTLSPAQLVERAVARGMDFLAVTDHNTTASQRELQTVKGSDIVLILGVESTTFQGHLIIWGIPDWVDFRVHTPEEMKAIIQFANERGGLTSCGHPKPYGPDWNYRDVTDFNCVEVWKVFAPYAVFVLRRQTSVDRDCTLFFQDFSSLLQEGGHGEVVNGIEGENHVDGIRV
jgi:hypothetical protein